MSERIRGALRNVLHKWTYTLLYFTNNDHIISDFYNNGTEEVTIHVSHWSMLSQRRISDIFTMQHFASAVCAMGLCTWYDSSQSITGCIKMLTINSTLCTKLLLTVFILHLRLRFQDIVTSDIDFHDIVTSW